MNPTSKIIERKIWLLRNGYEQTQIADELGLSRNIVWRTINGRDKNNRVTRWLLEHGCPEEIIDFPTKRQLAA
jgi:orotate phosphoribosyltransferase-like protein